MRKCLGEVNVVHTKQLPNRRLFVSKLDLNSRKKLVRFYIWSIALCDAETWDKSETSSELAGEFRNVVLEKDGEE